MSRSLFHKPRRDGRNGGGRHRRTAPKANRRKPCHFVDSGSRDFRGVEICATCDGLRTEPQHDWPETPAEVVEIRDRMTGERD